MSLEKVIRESVDAKTRDVGAPAVGVSALIRRGRRRVATRRIGVGLVALVALAAGGGVVSLVDDVRPPRERPITATMVPVGHLDYGDGLRAYMDPGSGKIQLGGTTVAIKGAWNIDTDAVATPYGLVAFRENRRPYLLEEDGTLTALSGSPDSPDKRFHPHARVDSARPLVAWAEYDGDDAVTIRLYDLRRREFTGQVQVPCATRPECRKVSIRALDQGLAFIRTPQGNQVWDPESGEWTVLGGSTIADVRNKVVMMTGRLPDESQRASLGDGWRYIQGQIDAQLSHDGRRKLYWSKRLTPTSDADRPVELDLPDGKGLLFVTFDTDGSVLAAWGERGERAAIDTPDGEPIYESPSRYRMYDCELPSGECAEIGRLKVTGGDPLFVGNDM